MEASPSVRKRAEPLLSPRFSHSAPHLAAACTLYHFEQRFMTLVSLVVLLKTKSVERAALTFTGSAQFPRAPVTPPSHIATRRVRLGGTTPTTPGRKQAS